MDFEQFLTQKRIDIETYQQVRPEEWLKLKTLYDLIGQKSFDQQKKFLFNPLRLAFPSKLPLPTKAESTSPKKIIPKTQPIANEQSNLGEVKEIPVTPLPSMKKMPPKMKPAMPSVETETKLEGDTPPPFPKKLPAKIKPITATPLEEPAPENQVETPPVPKKMPMKMKPVLPNSTEEPAPENQVETPPVPKKMPMKMKPILPNPTEEPAPENQVETPPVPKKMPMKMKPVLPNSTEEPAPENQAETPPIPKKMPMKMKPVLPNSTVNNPKE